MTARRLHPPRVERNAGLARRERLFANRAGVMSWAPTIGAAFVVGCGCTPIPAGTAFPTCQVSGRIVLQGAPTTFAGPVWVTLYPENGALGDPVTVRVPADGVFRTDRAPVGRLHVRVDAGVSARTRLPPPVVQNLGRLRSVASPVYFDSKAVGENTLTVELMP